MDPNATLKMLIDAYFEGSPEDMAEAGDALIDWIERKGYLPRVKDPDLIRDMVWVLSRLASDTVDAPYDNHLGEGRPRG